MDIEMKEKGEKGGGKSEAIGMVEENIEDEDEIFDEGEDWQSVLATSSPTARLTREGLRGLEDLLLEAHQIFKALAEFSARPDASTVHQTTKTVQNMLTSYEGNCDNLTGILENLRTNIQVK